VTLLSPSMMGLYWTYSLQQPLSNMKSPLSIFSLDQKRGERRLRVSQSRNGIKIILTTYVVSFPLSPFSVSLPKLISEVELVHLIAQALSGNSPLIWIICIRPKKSLSFNSSLHCEDLIVDDPNLALGSSKMGSRNFVTSIQPLSAGSKRDQTETELQRCVSGTSGLFASAQGMLRFVGDPDVRDPQTQSRHQLCLDLIENGHPLGVISSTSSPRSLLSIILTQMTYQQLSISFYFQ
jgi:hypothetical protein